MKIKYANIVFITLLALVSQKSIAQISAQGVASTTTSSVASSTTQIAEQNPKQIIFGKALWYGKGFNGRKMANGQIFSADNASIVAHRTLPLGTKIKITNTKNNKSVLATIKDRGPYSKNKKTKKYTAEIDVSYAIAKILEIDRAGIGDVKIEVY